MTTRTWNGSTDSFANSAAWSPAGTPQPGDTAVINSGTVLAAGLYLLGLNLQLNGATGSQPTLNLDNSNLPLGSTLTAKNSASFSSPATTLIAAGQNINSGIITLNGSRYDVQLNGDTATTAALLWNRGSINTVVASPDFTSPGLAGTIQNDGALAIWNPGATFQSAVIDETVTGGGTIQINPNARLDLTRAVGPGQTIDFSGGAGSGSFLQIDTPGAFQGLISGFAQGQSIFMQNLPFTNFTYTPTSASEGTLNLFSGGTLLGSLRFNGVYAQSDFNAAFRDAGGGINTLTITTTAARAQTVGVADQALSLAVTDSGELYNGPVAGLQSQYIWTGADPVGISAASNNAFLHGGSGIDTLVAQGGNNVLDGGGGTNVLIGAGGNDTFFVDGRAGVVTWSTVLNFHLGDQATIFGFHAGTSTLSDPTQDGNAGYVGATYHSALSGAGTGVNASITFAGLSADTIANHFAITTGTLNPGTAAATDYLLMQYNH